MRERLSGATFGVMAAVSLVVLFTPGGSVPGGIDVSDKLIHGALFAALGASGLLTGFPARRLALGLVAYACLSEVLQAVLPIDRDGDVLDAVADSVGVAIGLLLGVAIAQKR